jgi:hypothetical protein
MLEVMSAVSLAVESEQGAVAAAGAFQRPISPADGDAAMENDPSDWIDDLQDDDDSAGEDSDDDSLCNKLCTYTQTQKEFMNQHW